MSETEPIATRMRRMLPVRHPRSPGPPHPSRALFVGFAIAIAFGTGLLMLPIATESGNATPFIAALFTATSAVCVTGLIVVDTPEHWSIFGEVVILVMVQVGGLGIMTAASVLGLLVARRFGLRLQLTARAERGTFGVADLKRIVVNVVAISVAIEAVLTVVLTVRFAAGYGVPWDEALYSGVFHAVSSFNHAGFSLYSNSLVGFVADPWITVPVIVAIILGGLGFPVLFELARNVGNPRRWTLHSKITVLTTAVLFVVGFVVILAAEWSNPDTMGPLGVGGKMLAGLFASVTTRSAGFNTVDTTSMEPGTLLVMDVLMFIGGGSAGTAGGIKVTTFALLAFVILAEVRGEPSVHVLGRRVSATVQRQALTIALLGVGVVMSSTIILLNMTDHDLDYVLFEVISAFATCGLSVGITNEFPPAGTLLLTGLMFVGRLGPITAATALALRDRPRKYELPEDRPIVG